MEINMLHAYHGDKKKKLPTTTAEEREKTAEAIIQLKRSGIALFLEKGQDAYPVEGYDPETDQLIITVPFSQAELKMRDQQGRKVKKVKAKAEKAGRKVTGVAPVAGG